MKKTSITIITLFLLSINGALAQNKQFNTETFVGFNGGMTGSMVMFKPVVEQDYLIGYHGGLVFRHNSENHFGVQAELNYVQKGWQETNKSYSKRLDYIELPFMTHVYFGNKTQVYMNIGPKIGYMIHEQTLLDSDPTITPEQQKSIENSFDYGFAGGLGLLFNIKKQVYQLDTRANFSVSNLFSNEKKDYFDNSNNLNIGISLAWLYQVK